MNTDWNLALAERARLHAALGEPARLAIVDLLTLGDASPSENRAVPEHQTDHISFR